MYLYRSYNMDVHFVHFNKKEKKYLMNVMIEHDIKTNYGEYLCFHLFHERCDDFFYNVLYENIRLQFML
jgi:hypothetical protein